ncbi:formylglycine-generating enzyme family protein [Thiofilum flexile]|uniref:formylglycine-generating enzyme family protein n=1 Tax=Thiofilum flexile TaxID=125627 RepID=UPI0003703859|nr:formylglycine-generating enzyme family protein [Thiofilum flexile]
MPHNHLSPSVFPYTWASDWGQDQYGLWQAFTYRNVRHAFRWIPPGTFMMGSPEDEEGRYNREDLHQVTLTKGFWLGETTVTQALWQAVLQENPSHFQGSEHPVERVSWDDCQRFIGVLRNMHPELQVRLPWEAEWEYACRAGTKTPFYFGGKADLSKENVNYSGDWDKWGYEGETNPVKSYLPNPWGLYEMHGNVLEWCQDVWQGSLGKQTVTDPQGQAGGDPKRAKRMFRGGSWLYGGRLCRSSFRFRREPDFRYYNLGLRLSLGH